MKQHPKLGEMIKDRVAVLKAHATARLGGQGLGGLSVWPRIQPAVQRMAQVARALSASHGAKDKEVQSRVIEMKKALRTLKDASFSSAPKPPQDVNGRQIERTKAAEQVRTLLDGLEPAEEPRNASDFTVPSCQELREDKRQASAEVRTLVDGMKD